MAKSVRSKIKRKHRSEFRRTIGEEAAKKNRAIIQEKLKECSNTGSMNSFERLSNVLDTTETTDGGEMDTGSDSVVPADAMNNMLDEPKHSEIHKVPTKRSKKKKHSLKKAVEKKGRRERRKPRYFCEF